MAHTTLLILCGLPFAGKTTLAKEFEKQGFIRITVDEMNVSLGISFSLEKKISFEEWSYAYREYYKRIRQLLKQGKSVICDGVAFMKREREELRQIAKNYHVQTHVVYVQTPMPVARKRWIDNKKTKERQDIREDDFRHIMQYFQTPIEDESTLTYNEMNDQKRWVAQVIKTL